jgi:hypothetical protein
VAEAGAPVSDRRSWACSVLTRATFRAWVWVGDPSPVGVGPRVKTVFHFVCLVHGG